MKTCPYCAEEIQDAAVKCRHCGSVVDTADAKWRTFRREFAALTPVEQAERRATMSPEHLALVDACPPVPVAAVAVAPVQAWNPGVAAVLSLVIPGAGQMYRGNLANGLIWLVCVVIGYAMLIVPGLILHLLCIVFAASSDSNNRARVGAARPAG